MSPRARGRRGAATRIVVLGTGTGVGKTWVTRSLAEALGREGVAVVALKPIETGVAAASRSVPMDPRSTIRSADSSTRGLSSDGMLLAGASTVPPAPPPFVFAEPVSPHLAARRANAVIDLASVLNYVTHHENDMTRHVTSFVLVESAGACLSPLAPGITNVDLALALDPALWILVAPDALGVLHDVSAALVALGVRRRLPDYVVLSAAREPDASTGTNAGELAALGIVTPVVSLGRGDDRSLDAFARLLVERANAPR
jgi:dethiobiotin synthetase